MRFLDWLTGKDNKLIYKPDTELTKSVEQEIARSVATRHQLERKVVRYYPLIADQLVPYRGDKYERSA